MSRAALAQRFAKLVGEPPMAYLTGIRLAQAADLLRESDATLDAIARRVGYGTAFGVDWTRKALEEADIGEEARDRILRGNAADMLARAKTAGRQMAAE